MGLSLIGKNLLPKEAKTKGHKVVPFAKMVEKVEMYPSTVNAKNKMRDQKCNKNKKP